MDGMALRDARQTKNWTQQEAAEALGVTQAYLSMLETGARRVSDHLTRKALTVLDLPPTAIPLKRPAGNLEPSRKRDFGAELAGLGYPGFAYLRTRVRSNPAGVLLDALNQSDLDTRVVEGLPWVVLHYVDMDWGWLLQNAKLKDQQNRLGFAVSLAREIAVDKGENEKAQKLGNSLEVLERARLAREDTFCHDSMTQAERAWLRNHRPPEARHWSLLTDLESKQLAYAS
jgi:transcriptional regulator with XRE-family HTH domain